ncbi:MAG: hypothetical protein K8L97_27840 [Anaerolineae bacterium]|nr:hypothetical protein [Anaerolineae bacterium]
MRRTILLLIVCLLCMAAPTLAQTFSETYTSQDRRTTISYPKGWFVSEENGSITVSTVEGEAVDIESRLEPGTAAISFLILDDETDFFPDTFEGNSPVEKLESLIAIMQKSSFDPDTTLPFSNPIAITIGDYPSARTASTYKGSRNQFVIFLIELDDQTSALAVGLTPADEMIRVEPKFIDIAATLRYSSIPAVEAGNPINVDMLDSLTTDNAVSLTQLSTLRGHREPVFALALSPDGSQLVSGGFQDGLLYVWDVRSGERTLSLEGHQGGIQWLVFSPDGKYIASLGGEDGTLRVWDAATGEQSYMTEKSGGLWYAAFSPDSESIAYISFVRGSSGALTSSTVWLWDFQTGEEIMLKAMPASRFANSINFNAEGTQIIFCAWEDMRHEAVGTWVYDVDAGEITLEKTWEGDPIDVYFTASDAPIVSLKDFDSGSGTHIWDVERETNLIELEDDDPFQTLLNPARAIVGTTGMDSEARLYDASDGTLLTTLAHDTVVYGLAYSLDGRVVATSDEQGVVYLWGVPLE